MTRLITKIILGVVTLFLVVYDIVIAIEPTRGDTISKVMLDLSWEYSIIPFCWGVLCGHLYWPASYSKKIRIIALVGLICFTGVVVALDVSGVLPRIIPIVPLMAGIVAGHYGWSQVQEEGNGR